MSPPIYKQARKQACGLIMSWVAHQNEHESSMMGLQAPKWLFVAVTTTTITKLLGRGGGRGGVVLTTNMTKGAPTSFASSYGNQVHIPTRRRRRRRNTKLL